MIERVNRRVNRSAKEHYSSALGIHVVRSHGLHNFSFRTAVGLSINFAILLFMLGFLQATNHLPALQPSTLWAAELENPASQQPSTATIYLPIYRNERGPTWPSISVTPLEQKFDTPIQVTHAGDGSGRLFVIDRGGTIHIIDNGTLLETPFLDISNRITTRVECGLLSMAFPPNYAEEGYFLVYYNHKDNLVGPEEVGCDSVVARFTLTADDNVADPDSEADILVVDQPYSNHNGGQIAFGPDGLLYVGLGDGGSANDPQGYGQNPASLLGKMLRLEVGATGGYSIPSTNPFLNSAAIRDEIWAIGLRNPWRFSFDRTTGDLYIADVGQGSYEEINRQPVSSLGGENYGWNIMEGAHCFAPPQQCSQSNLTLPIWEYDHSQGDFSVTGGYVYRGADYLGMQGIYLYGDFVSGRIWGLQQYGSQWMNRELLKINDSIAAFGEDEAGNLYVIGFNSDIYRIQEGAISGRKH